MKIRNYSVFPSIITEVDCPCFQSIKPNLINWIYDFQKKSESVNFSNRGGWQSNSDFWKQESFFHFYEYIFLCISSSIKFYNREFDMGNMWVNINKKGNYNIEHDHPRSILSGVLWVQIPQNSGNLRFPSPKIFLECDLLDSANENFKQQFNYYQAFDFTPKEGLIVMFPSHMRHLVEENESDQDRISISFNLI